MPVTIPVVRVKRAPENDHKMILSFLDSKGKMKRANSYRVFKSRRHNSLKNVKFLINELF